MIRRLLPLALAAAFTAPCFAAAQQWDFQVFLDDRPIGHHQFTLQENGAERSLTSEARLTVKVLGFNAYHYAHDASERWQGNCLTALTARTDDDDGKRNAVSVERQGEKTLINGPRGRETVQGCVMTFAYWNPEMLRQTQLLNPQTGLYETVHIAALGEDTITLRGKPTPARHYRITGPKDPIDLWYGADQSWLALQSTVDGGRKLRYLLK